MVTSEINEIATAIAKANLKSYGYFMISITHVSDEEYIEADGKSRRIFLKLKVAQYPRKPSVLTEEELVDTIANAETADREPWVATFQIDENKQLLGRISWQNLGKK